MTKAEFQGAYGPEWAEFTGRPSFFAAMQLASAEKLNTIASLTNEQINIHGKEILADFRGHLNHENFLIGLAVEAEPTGFDLPEETYQESPVQAPPVQEPVQQDRPFAVFQAQQKTAKPKVKKKKPE